MFLFNNINMEKIFELKKDNLKLKININKNNIITSWLHSKNTKFTNNREFNIEQLNFAFNTLKPVCSTDEYIIIKDFMFNKKEEGKQLSLF